MAPALQHKRQEDDEKGWLNFQNRPREDLEVEIRQVTLNTLLVN